MCPGSQRGHLCPGVHRDGGRGLPHPALHWCSPTWSPGGSFGVSIEEGHQNMRECPEEGNPGGEGSVKTKEE